MDLHLVKHSGQVFTPDHIVALILDYCGYHGKDILEKHIIDNSCGDGAFLCIAVSRYCVQWTKGNGNKLTLKKHLETFIHGIELDKVAFSNCLYNLDTIAAAFGIEGVQWDIHNTDAIQEKKYNGKMDYVVGNPPYVRVHNLGEQYSEVKSFSFAEGGMTDLYLVFFEIGFKMLTPTGKLCYITPSSWLNSLAAKNMRDYVKRTKHLTGIIDFGHTKMFENVMTYVLISFFDNAQVTKQFDYSCYDEATGKVRHIDNLSFSDIAIDYSFYLGTKEELRELKNIKEKRYPTRAVVKNGYATLADKVFILNVPFREFTIPIIKGSTGKWHQGFFPYDKHGKPLPKEQIFSVPAVAEYLNENKESLLKGKPEEEKPDWYLYGRTQALKDTFEDKLSINCIIKDISSIKLYEVPNGSGVYSGLYILSYAPTTLIESIVKSDDFISFLKVLKKYKSGGYYTFSTKDLEQFLNYKLSSHEEVRNYPSNGQSNVLEGSLKFL